MTHVRQPASLRRSRTDTEWWDRSSLWPHVSAMDGARSERTLRFGRTKQINEVVAQKKTTATRRHLHEKMRAKKVSDHGGKMGWRQEKKQGGKSYPLRGRVGQSNEEGLSCRVLLTRLEESLQEKQRLKGKDKRLGSRAKFKERKGKRKTKATSLSKSNIKSGGLSHSEGPELGGPQPRKRRLASLNAEAVNTLLLERPTDAQQAKRQCEPVDGGVPLDVEACRSDITTCLKASRGKGSQVSKPQKHEVCQDAKLPKKAKVNRSGRSVWMSQEYLDAPAPRRLAGLNAAALLKLTSSSATSKQRIRATPTATVTSDSATPAVGLTTKQQQQQHHKAKLKPKRHSHKGKTSVTTKNFCTTCKKMADFEPNVKEWMVGSCAHPINKPDYHSGGLLPYPLKHVKEEQVETELSPYYCCPPEGSMEYCHRLAFFLSQQPYADSGHKPLNSSPAPVKQECMVTPSPVTHSHPHPHTGLTLTHHPCLCTADPCFSSYYVHIAHPTHSRASSSTLPSPPMGFMSSRLCPSRMSNSKVLGGRMSHPSELTHPYCNSVDSSYYEMGGYTYSTMPSVDNRRCGYNPGCTGCGHGIKTEGYPRPEDKLRPPILIPPNLPIPKCPLPSVPTSTRAKPRLLTPLTERDRSRVRLNLANQFPKSTEASGESVTVGRTRLAVKRRTAVPNLSSSSTSSSGCSSSSSKQKKVSRRRATNGWRPVGMPTEREVFIAGEDETSLRQCYEGVERDGEVIHVRDTVLLRSGPRKKSLPYVAKISALWEDPKTGELMMSLFWYYRPEHTQGGRDPRAHCENEIFASRHQDENSVACIEDRCYVLPLAQYCRFCALMKKRAQGVPSDHARSVPTRPDFSPPSHRCVPSDVDPDLVYLCRHVYDFRYGRVLKNLQ